LSLKILNIQQEQTVKSQRHQLVQDENDQLREEIRKLKSENRQQSANLKDQRKVKELEEAINGMNQELEFIKQERDTYKDRF